MRGPSYKHACIPSLLDLPSTNPVPSPPSHRRALSWAPCIRRQLPASYLVYTWNRKCQWLSSIWGCRSVQTPWAGACQVPLSMGILQERIAFAISRGSSQPRDRAQVFCFAGRFFIFECSVHMSRLLSLCSTFFRFCPHVLPPCLRLYVCSANRLICTVFLDSIHTQ